MNKTKKFNFRVVSVNNKWTTEILRRVTSKKIHVSKIKEGFSSELEAQQWGEQQVELFAKKLTQKNQRQTK